MGGIDTHIGATNNESAHGRHGVRQRRHGSAGRGSLGGKILVAL